MYNFNGHPWAKILNEKLESTKTLKTRIGNLRDKMFGEKSKKEKYFYDFFQLIIKNEQQADKAKLKNDFEMIKM